MVKSYTDKQIFDRIKSLPSYNPKRGIPDDTVVLIMSNEDTPNIFDDKLYPYIDGVNPFVASCTGNAGGPILTGGWKKYSSKGAAIIARDEIYYDAYRKSDGKAIRHHNGKMPCLRLVGNLKYYRDNDNDNKAEQLGEPIIANYATNIHLNSYNLWNKVVNTVIGNWSAGCIVLNNAEQYRRLLDIFNDNPITLVVLNEF